MSARRGGRHCASCDRVVHELHTLTRSAAERLVREQHARVGSVCARIALDAEGAPIFAATSSPGRSVPRALALATALVAGCADTPPRAEKPTAVLTPLNARPVDAGPRGAGPGDAGARDEGTPETPPGEAASVTRHDEETTSPTDRALAARERRKHAAAAANVPMVFQGMMEFDL